MKESENIYRALSMVDNLAQLYNSRHFNKQLQIEIDRVNRYNDPLTLILFDIDNFKDFNDAYGHVEGDRVFMCLGQVVKKCLRKTDTAYRYGGEEFTVILPMTKKENGFITAENTQESDEQIFCLKRRGGDDMGRRPCERQKAAGKGSRLMIFLGDDAVPPDVLR